MYLDEFTKLDQYIRYIETMRPIFKKKALYSDTTGDYLSPTEPNAYDEVTIRFRAAKNNIDRVFFVHEDKKFFMEKESWDEEFDYYVHKHQLDDKILLYHFEFSCGKIKGIFDTRGVTQSPDAHFDFTVIPGFKTPDWAKGAVMYQIFVDRFCNGDKSNDIKTNEYRYIGQNVRFVEDWNRYPETMDVRDFYGGDLQGVLDKLDYLQDLGIEVIYFNPLFVSPSNHKYDIQDYDYIDPHFGKIVEDQGELLIDGREENKDASLYINRVANKKNLEASNELFVKVVEEAHRRGIRVILDGVFNHCGSFNKWMDRERIYENVEGYEKGAFISKESAYQDYFRFHEDKWPYNNTYDGWWGHETLPKLNYEDSKALFDYVMHIAAKWVSPPYNADGWRLDVAADLGHSQEYNHYFWREFRKAVKSANPDAVILAEHYGNTREWLLGDEWDTVMNYDAFMEPLTWFFTGMEKHSDDYREDLRGNAESFWNAMMYHTASFSMPSFYTAMNELSNHDHSRFLTRTNRKVGRIGTVGPQAANEGVSKAVFREAVTVQMTWPGAPTIYYGDEAGVCGFTDPDNRRTYPWGHEDMQMIAFHKEMIRLHKSCPELKTGSIKPIDSEYNFLAYARFNKNAQTIVLINNNDYEITKNISVWEAGIPKETILTQLMESDGNGYSTERKEYTVISGKISVRIPATGAIVLRHQG